mgnify:CR=1 FL=1
MSIIKILFFGAHPDDVELGCGGTIHKFCSEGHIVRVVSIGEGTSCRFEKKHIQSVKVRNEIKKKDRVFN